MVFTAYELLARLRHLTLTGQDENGDLEWVGTRQQWQNMENEIDVYENEDRYI